MALAECCFGGPRLGARVARRSAACGRDALLFGESQSRMLVVGAAPAPRRGSAISRRREDVPFTVLGEVRGHSLVIGDLIDLPLEVGARALAAGARAAARRLSRVYCAAAVR